MSFSGHGLDLTYVIYLTYVRLASVELLHLFALHLLQVISFREHYCDGRLTCVVYVTVCPVLLSWNIYAMGYFICMIWILLWQPDISGSLVKAWREYCYIWITMSKTALGLSMTILVNKSEATINCIDSSRVLRDRTEVIRSYSLSYFINETIVSILPC